MNILIITDLGAKLANKTSSQVIEGDVVNCLMQHLPRKSKLHIVVLGGGMMAQSFSSSSKSAQLFTRGVEMPKMITDYLRSKKTRIQNQLIRHKLAYLLPITRYLRIKDIIIPQTCYNLEIYGQIYSYQDSWQELDLQATVAEKWEEACPQQLDLTLDYRKMVATPHLDISTPKVLKLQPPKLKKLPQLMITNTKLLLYLLLPSLLFIVFILNLNPKPDSPEEDELYLYRKRLIGMLAPLLKNPT